MLKTTKKIDAAGLSSQKQTCDVQATGEDSDDLLCLKTGVPLSRLRPCYMRNIRQNPLFYHIKIKKTSCY